MPTKRQVMIALRSLRSVMGIGVSVALLAGCNNSDTALSIAPTSAPPRGVLTSWPISVSYRKPKIDYLQVNLERGETLRDCVKVVPEPPPRLDLESTWKATISLDCTSGRPELLRALFFVTYSAKIRGYRGQPETIVAVLRWDYYDEKWRAQLRTAYLTCPEILDGDQLSVELGCR